MAKYIFLGICLLFFGVHGQEQFPWNVVGFNPTSFSNQLRSQMQGLNLGLQNMGANIQAMTQNIVANSVNQAQTSFQTSLAGAIHQAEADGTIFDFSELRLGEFRQFTDSAGNTRGFSKRTSDGTTIYMIFSSASYPQNYLFANGPRGNQVITF